MKALIYGRVSTDDQADKGYSLPTQLQACRAYAQRLGFEIVGDQHYRIEEGKLVKTVQGDDAFPAFVEDCSGAIPISERPEGKKAAAMLKQHDASAIIVYQVDRLSRDIVDLLATVRDWIRAGIQVHSCDIGRVENELDIVLVIKGWQGSDERKKIAERTTRGRNGKAEGGKVVGQGFPPYGYSFLMESNGHTRPRPMGLVICEPEAVVIRLIYRLYVFGDGGGKPLAVYSIARKLSEMGAPTPGEVHGCYRLRQSGIWGELTIHRMLANETYCGIWRYRKTAWKNGREIPRPLDEQFEIRVPPIVDRALWEAAQERRECNKRMSKRNAKREYLLRGLLRCGCGANFVGQVGANPKRRHRYYRCLRRAETFVGLEKVVCEERGVRADVLERIVWDYVMHAIVNTKDLEKALRKAQKTEVEALQPKRQELESVLGLMEHSRKEAEKLGKALASVPEGIVSQTLQHQISQLEEVYAAQVKRRDELETELKERRLTDEAISEALLFRENVLLGMENPTSEDKRRVLEVLKTQVVIQDRKAVVRCYLPTEPGVIDLQRSQSHSRRPSPARAWRAHPRRSSSEGAERR